MSSRIQQKLNLSALGGIGSPSADGRGANMQRDNYRSGPSYNNRYHYASPEYYTSIQQPTAKKSKMSSNLPQDLPPPLPSILTRATSFDSGITSNAGGQSPGNQGRAINSQAKNRNNVNALLPRSASGPLPLPPLSQHALPYPPPGLMAPEGYSYHVGAPQLSRNTPYGDMYYQHPNAMPHGIPSDPYLHYHHAPPFNGQHYYPYLQPWNHHHHNSTHHEPATHHMPPMVVSSSIVVNNAPIASVEYITELGEHDVLSGRGGATNSYRGNRAFRVLVKKYQDQYLKAKKRDKPAVASLIVETIRKRGGRFLRRDTSQFRRRPNRSDGFDSGSMIQWVDIGDDRAREKTCQALREGAPELRRQSHRGSDTDCSRRWNTNSRDDSPFSFDDDIDVDSGSREKGLVSAVMKETRLARSSEQCEDGRYHWRDSSNGRQARNNVDSESDADDDTPEVRNGANESSSNSYHPVEEITFSDEDEKPILIRPWARLLPDRDPVEPIGLHQLSVQDRDLYLRDFLPPNPRYEMQHPHNVHGTPVGFRSDSNSDNIRFNVTERRTYDLYSSSYDDGKSTSIRKNDGKNSQWPILTA